MATDICKLDSHQYTFWSTDMYLDRHNPDLPCITWSLIRIVVKCESLLLQEHLWHSYVASVPGYSQHISYHPGSYHCTRPILVFRLYQWQMANEGRGLQRQNMLLKKLQPVLGNIGGKRNERNQQDQNKNMLFSTPYTLVYSLVIQEHHKNKIMPN